ncbi:MAG: tetratricopeptide repeat protein, partial [Verrucomicrobiae bacterium]|nr:tetratricopeptide repeat protein [Verrucomicrobiae bacterium]
MRRKLCTIGLLVVCALGLVWAPGCGRVSNQERHLRRAANLFEQGDYDRAEIECLNALRLEPTNLTALKMLGVIAHEQGRVVRAHVLLGQLRDVMPEDLDVRVRYGRCLLDGGRGKEARQEAMFVLERDPTNGRALVLFAESSQTAEELSDAKEFIEKLATKAGHVPEYYVALGTISVRMGDVDAGERHFNRAVGLDPNCSIAHLALGNLAVLRNDRDTAERELGLAATLAPARSIARVRY